MAQEKNLTACGKCKYVIRSTEYSLDDKARCKAVMPGNRFNCMTGKFERCNWYECHLINVDGHCQHYAEGEPT